MSAGMAEVIAAHYMDRDIYICDCGWVWAEHAGNAGSPLIHADHVAEELAKAGYGLVPDVAPEYGAPFMGHGGLTAEPFGHGPVRDPNWWEKSTHVRMVGPWRELEPLPDALRNEPQHG